MVPLEVQHIAAFGMDLALGSYALGAAQVVVAVRVAKRPDIWPL